MSNWIITELAGKRYRGLVDDGTLHLYSEWFPEFEMWVHLESRCKGDHCVIHNPSDHLMKEMPLHWRGDRGIFERICIHGTGHPDPDQNEFWKLTRQEWQGIHGCCGCCV